MRARNTERGAMCGLTRVSTMETGMRTELKVMAPTHGLTVDSTLGPGRITTCMGTECIPGEMAGDMKDTTRWTRNTGMESTLGLTADGMKAIGSTASNMARASTYYQMGL